MASADAAIVCWETGPPGHHDPGHDPATSGPGAVLAALIDRYGTAQRLVGARTMLVVAADDLPDSAASAHPTVVVPDLPTALHRAVTALAGVETDLALVAVEFADQPGRWLVGALRRLAESFCAELPPVAVVRAVRHDGPEGVGVSRAEDLHRLLTDAADGWWPEDDPLAEPQLSNPPVAVMPVPAPIRAADDPQLVLWSAPDAEAERRLRRAMVRLVQFEGDLFGPDHERVGLLTRHSARQARPGGVRGAIVVQSPSGAAEALGDYSPGTARRRPVALLFPGQGAQYPCMAAGLYDHEPVFTTAMDTFFTLWGDGGDRLRSEWLSDDPTVPFDDGSRAQPLLFAVGYALGAMVRSWGVQPVALLGHSAGEMVAATLGGVFTLPAAVNLMRERVTEVVKTPPGGMLAVAATADELTPYLALDPTGQVAVAAVNAPRQTLLAGPDEALAVVQEKLREQGYICRRAKARQAFHSPAVLAASLATKGAVEAAAPQPPADTVYSAYTGRVLDEATARDATFWTHQISEPVLFWPALDALLSTQDLLLLEAGAGQGLTNVARQHRAVRSQSTDVVALLPAAPNGPVADRRAVLTAAARLWTEGHQLRWDALDGVRVSTRR